MDDTRDIQGEDVADDERQVASDDVGGAAEPTAVSPTVELQQRDRIEVQSGLHDVGEPSTMPRWALAVMMAAAIAVVAAIAVAMMVPPTLALDRVSMDFDATALESESLTSSVYASNDGYEVVGLQASGVTDDGTGRKLAHIEVALANESFSVVVGVDRAYELVGRQWEAGGYRITSVEATPVAPVLDELALADIQKIMGKAAPYYGKYLEQLYDGGEFEVIESDLSRDDDGNYVSTVTISMHKVSGLQQYDGEVVATFRFFPGAASRDAGAWHLVSASAEQDAWKPSVASVVGVWTGTLVSADNTALLIDTGRCYAGRSISFRLTVSSYDVDTGRMVATVRFVSHNHAGIPEDAPGTDGDVVVYEEDVTVRLDTRTLEGAWSPVEQTERQGAYEVRFIQADGVWRARVTSGEKGSDGLLALGMTEFVDTYELERS